MAGSASIYRIDANGDTESDARTANQIVEFNGGTNPDALSFLETYDVHWIEDISKHPNPKKALDKLQDGLLGTREVVLTGWLENPDNSVGQVRLSTWMKDAKANASLPVGRFGIRVDDFSDVADQTPSSSTAYMLHDVQLTIPPDHPYECNFIIKLWMNGAHP